MSNKDEALNRMMLENARLKTENAQLRENQMQHCRSCKFAKVHDCGALFYCDAHGSIINLDKDGCSWRKEK